MVIDADDKGLKARVDELLARIVTDASAGARRDAERIALVVPAREIENWYVHLCVPAARPIDETRDYKPTPEWRELDGDIGKAAKQCAAAWPPDSGSRRPAVVVGGTRGARARDVSPIGYWPPTRGGSQGPQAV